LVESICEGEGGTGSAFYKGYNRCESYFWLL